MEFCRGGLFHLGEETEHTMEVSKSRMLSHEIRRRYIAHEISCLIRGLLRVHAPLLYLAAWVLVWSIPWLSLFSPQNQEGWLRVLEEQSLVEFMEIIRQSRYRWVLALRCYFLYNTAWYTGLTVMSRCNVWWWCHRVLVWPRGWYDDYIRWKYRENVQKNELLREWVQNDRTRMYL